MKKNDVDERKENEIKRKTKSVVRTVRVIICANGDRKFSEKRKVRARLYLLVDGEKIDFRFSTCYVNRVIGMIFGSVPTT